MYEYTIIETGGTVTTAKQLSLVAVFNLSCIILCKRLLFPYVHLGIRSFGLEL